MIIFILRGVFVVLTTAVAMLYILGVQLSLGADVGKVLLMLAMTLGLSAVVITVDVYTPRKKLSAVSGVFLGLIAGLLAAYALSFVVDLFGVVVWPDLHTVLDREISNLTPDERKLLAISQLLQGVKVFIGLITCYIGISLVLQTKDDFRFVIPYVEFTKQIRGNRPTILDTSIIIDGRILDIVATNILQGTVMVPRFVLNELQTISDSGDKLKRARGRRGLDILQKLQQSNVVDVTMEEADYEGGNVDQKLVAMALAVKGRLMTNDFNLKKVAELRGVEIINLNDLTSAMRPVVLPGEHMTVRIQKPGEGATQGVGYLEDGTMVVVENARHHVGEEVIFNVTSNYQTSAGRMIFGVMDAMLSTQAHEAANGAGNSAPEAPGEGTPPRADRPGHGRNPRRS